MSGVVGLFRRDGGTASEATVGRMLDRIDHRGPDDRGVHREGPAGLGGCRLVTTPRDRRAATPTVADGGEFVVAAHARIDNRRSLVEAVGDRHGVGVDDPDGELILAAYREWGPECPAHLVGAFAFSLFDADRGRLVCARDHLGIRPLYCHRSPGVVAVASEPKGVLAHPAVGREIDERRLAEHLAGTFEGGRRTFYRDVERIPPAHVLTVDRGAARLDRYWTLDPGRTVELPSDAAYAARFRELFDRAVGCRLATPGGGAPAATLSGGLDSSAVVCTAREAVADDVPTYTTVFDSVPAADERGYAEAVVDGGGVDPTFVPGDRRSPVAGLGRAVDSLDGAAVLPNYFVARGMYRAAAADGARVVLEGYDGDTTLSHGEGYLADLAAAGRLPGLARELDGLAREFGVRRRRLVRSQLLPHVLPDAVTRRYHRLRSDHPTRWSTPVVDPEFAERVDLRERRDAVGHPDPDEAVRSRRAGPATDDGDRGLSRVRREHYLNLTDPVVTATLELADAMALSRGIQPRFPFFDRRLVEFCLALPADQKIRRGRTRGVLRRGLADVLPAAVRTRGGKADLSPNFEARLRACGRDRIDRVLDDPSVVDGFVDRAALERARSALFEDGGAAPNASLELWKAVTAEEWVRRTVRAEPPTAEARRGGVDAGSDRAREAR